MHLDRRQAAAASEAIAAASAPAVLTFFRKSASDIPATTK